MVQATARSRSTGDRMRPQSSSTVLTVPPYHDVRHAGKAGGQSYQLPASELS